MRRLEHLKILVAEDNADVWLVTQFFLEREGAETFHACDGIEAIEMAFQDDYNLVLMDIQMPQLDGLRATAELRRRGYDRPILALTAHAMREDREKSLLSGCDDHLTKPIRPDSLVEHIIAAMQRRQVGC